MQSFRILIMLVMLAAAASLLFAGESRTGTAGKYAVVMMTHPQPPVVGNNQLMLTITNGGAPLKGASVTAHIDMAGMSMPADVEAKPGTRDGEYLANVNFGMAGTWKVTVAVQQMAGMAMAGDGKTTFTVATAGASSSPSASPAPMPTAPAPSAPQQGVPLPWVILGGVVVAVLVIAVVVLRRKK